MNKELEYTIPGFMLWLRKSRDLSVRELAILVGISPSEVTYLEKSRNVLPYRNLRLIYQKVLTDVERDYFLRCMKGHVKILMEVNDDAEFRRLVRSPDRDQS